MHKTQSKLYGPLWWAQLLAPTSPTQGVWLWLGRLAFKFFLLTLISILLLVVSDHVQPKDMAITRYLARLQTPLTATFYAPQARDQISIFLYDASLLEQESLAWPIPYGEHALWLQKAAGDGDPTLRPKALFVDITFGQERNDPSIVELREALCTIQLDWKVPVFLAALPDERTGQLRLRPDLQGAKRDGRPCFTLVGVDYEPDPVDGLAWTYSLIKQVGHSLFGDNLPEQHSTPSAYRSAALAIAQDAAKLNIEVLPDPLALQWGIESSHTWGAAASANASPCKPGTNDQLAKLMAPISGLIGLHDPRPICPYHGSLSVGDLNQMSEQALRAALKDQYVLVGAKVQGYNDWVDTPIHGSIPGIHAHAMALDNLLTYQDQYKLSRGWGELFHHPGDSTFFLLLGAAALCVLAVLSVGAVRDFLTQSWRKKTPGPGLNSMPPGWGGVTRHFLGEAWAWSGLLLLRILVATVAIQALSSCFRLGMLPVMELIGMVLLWESTEWMKKLQNVLSGKKDEGH